MSRHCLWREGRVGQANSQILNVTMGVGTLRYALELIRQFLAHPASLSVKASRDNRSPACIRIAGLL